MRFRGNKYGAVKVKDSGYTFDSKAEHRRWQELSLLVSAAQISDLCVHPRYPLNVAGKCICIYIPDFTYREKGRLVAEDVKGVVTDAYRIKRELFKVLYPDADFRELKLGRAA